MRDNRDPVFEGLGWADGEGKGSDHIKSKLNRRTNPCDLECPSTLTPLYTSPSAGKEKKEKPRKWEERRLMGQRLIAG